MTYEANHTLVMSSWAAERGITSKVKVGHFGGMRGAAADAEIQADDVVVSVPLNCLIHEDTAQASGIVSIHSLCRPAWL